MDPISQYQQALLRQQDRIDEVRHERYVQKLQRDTQLNHSANAVTRPLDTLMVAVGSRLESVGRAMQGSRRQRA